MMSEVELDSQRDTELFLSVLSGHWRYAHIAALRAGGVSAALLGMNAVVSEDTVRRALKAMDEVVSVR